MANLVNSGRTLGEYSYFIEDEFTWDQTDLTWVDVITDTGTATVGDAVGGIMALTPSDGTVTNNDEVYLRTANEVFKFAAGKPMFARCRMQYTEGATDDANVFFGFLNAIAADALVDDGAGIRTSGSGAVIYKVDGGTKWICQTMMNGTQTTTTSTTTAGGATAQELAIEVSDGENSQINVTFKVDGKYLVDTNGYVIRHLVTIASPTEMHLGWGLKNGADTTVETLNIDWVQAGQLR